MEEDPVNIFMNLDQWQEKPFNYEEELQSFASFSSSSSSVESYLVGFVLVQIIGNQYYRGPTSNREMVILIRESDNPEDSNAINIFSSKGIQIGYVEPFSAAILSPLIDSNLINVEGVIPKFPRIIYHDKFPCQIHIFAPTDAFTNVQLKISRGGLHLFSDFQPSFALSDALIVNEKKSKEFGFIDEIFKWVGQGADHANKKVGMEELDPPKEIITTAIFKYQKKGLGWMVHRENSCQLPPFWEVKDGIYVNVLTNYQTDKRPQPLRGGIFADDMGLGKTLTLLSLIATNKPKPINRLSSSAIDTSCSSGFVEASGEVDEWERLSGSLGMNSKKAKLGRKSTSLGKIRKMNDTDLVSKGKGEVEELIDEMPTVLGPKTTLVVCPPSVISTWLTQLEYHTKPGSLKVYMYHGDRTRDAEKLKKYDIVLTTYSTLAIEVEWPESPMKKIEWWRIILDEAHVIKNVTALQTKAVIVLKAKRRWIVTGTPIQNGSFDLFSFMAFLKFEPFSIKGYWQSLVQHPLEQGNESGLSRLQVLMQTISLRRTKDKVLIGLPHKTLETCFVELSGEEREKYDQVEEVAKGMVQDYIFQGSVIRNYTTVLSIILRLRQICNDVDLCPSDVISLLPSIKIEDLSSNPELLKKMALILQDGDDLSCPVCWCPPTNTIITCCAHIFCRGCILKSLKCLTACCPMCRHPLKESDLFLAPPEFKNDVPGISSSNKSTSSKVFTLMRLLKASRDANPSAKSVVFSQFRKMLILLEQPLKEAGFEIFRLDGSMTAKKRAQVIKEFNNQDSGATTILLASLKTSGAGINLTVASRVYLMEPWWNPAVEEQAMNRVHRIGQNKDVKIVKLIVKDTIEERILELQAKKQKLAKEAFRKKNLKDRGQIGVEDLRALMSL